MCYTIFSSFSFIKCFPELGIRDNYRPTRNLVSNVSRSWAFTTTIAQRKICFKCFPELGIRDYYCPTQNLVSNVSRSWAFATTIAQCENLSRPKNCCVVALLYSRRHEKCRVNKKTRKIVRFYSNFILKKTGDMYLPSG